MTKMKSKKMTKSTLAIIIMAVALVALLAFGGTYAYFTATTATKSTTISTGKIQLKSNSATFESSLTNIMPGTVIIGNDPFTVSTEASTEASYIAIKFVITATDASGAAIADLSSINLGSILTSDWLPVEADHANSATSVDDNVYVYAPSGTIATTAASTTRNITVTNVIFDATDDWAESTAGTLNEYSTNKLMEATITISIQAKALQSTGFGSATPAIVAHQLFPGDVTPAQGD